MMNVPPSEGAGLSLWEYEALLFHWNEAHDTSGDMGAPDADEAMRVLEAANLDPRLIN